MKHLMLIALILAPALSFAQNSASVQAVVRDAKFNAKIQTVTVKDLISTERFDGQYFKIVKGKSEEAVSFGDPDKNLVLRAATTYFHLNKARGYFADQLGSAYVRGLPKIVVRIEHTNQFNELGHFANDALDPQYNNALTIPAGAGMEGRGIKPWEMEIWFRPVKKVNVEELKIKGGAGMGEWTGVLAAFRQQMHMSSLQRFLSQSIQSQLNENAAPLTWESVLRTAGTSLLLEAVYQYADPLSRMFSRKWFWLDSALVPEIIYHEYAHVALSDHLFLSHSSAVIEGMADFFAGKIADSANLATKIDQYNVFNGKKAERKQMYMVEFETSDYANSDFVFGMLWDLDSIVGKTSSPALCIVCVKRSTQILRSEINSSKASWIPARNFVLILSLADSRFSSVTTPAEYRSKSVGPFWPYGNVYR